MGYSILVTACGIQFPDQGLNPGPLHWERGVLATGSPGKPWPYFYTALSMAEGGGWESPPLHRGLDLDMCACSLSHVRLFATPWTVARQAPLSVDFPGKNTGVGFHFLLQGILPTQGWNPHLLYCRQILHHRATREAPRGHSRTIIMAAAERPSPVILSAVLTTCQAPDEPFSSTVSCRCHVPISQMKS